MDGSWPKIIYEAFGKIYITNKHTQDKQLQHEHHFSYSVYACYFVCRWKNHNNMVPADSITFQMLEIINNLFNLSLWRFTAMLWKVNKT